MLTSEYIINMKIIKYALFFMFSDTLMFQKWKNYHLRRDCSENNDFLLCCYWTTLN